MAAVAVDVIKESDSSLPRTITTTPVAQPQVYLWHAPDKSRVYVTHDLPALLDTIRESGGEGISEWGVAMLLQSGVVPPPETALEGLYVLGPGHEARLDEYDGKLSLDFSQSFPFSYEAGDTSRVTTDTEALDTTLLEALAESVLQGMHSGRETVLFHSAGKDSNTIALAIAEAGRQKDVVLVTHRSERGEDESEVSARVARYLGFEHRVLSECGAKNSVESIDRYWQSVPLPCVDPVAISYPCYFESGQLQPGSTLIDGSGNDLYMGFAPSKRETRRQRLSRLAPVFRPIVDTLPSANLLRVLGRSRAEWAALRGLSLSDAQAVFPVAQSAYPYWRGRDKAGSTLSWGEYRTQIRGTTYAWETVTRKIRNAAAVYNCNLLFPWMDSRVVETVMQYPKALLADHSSGRNKLLLRNMLQKRGIQELTGQSKRPFMVNWPGYLQSNLEQIVSLMYNRGFWRADGLAKLASRAQKHTTQNEATLMVLYRLWAVDAWAARWKNEN